VHVQIDADLVHGGFTLKLVFDYSLFGRYNPPCLKPSGLVG
jgi:hypothetical protein